jgi:hypothetical protein
LNVFNLSPTKEDLNDENCVTRISEANLASVSILNNSKRNEDDRPVPPSDHSESKKTQEEMDNSQDENALGLIMSMISETYSDENKNLPKIKRKISRISMTSSIDCKSYL